MFVTTAILALASPPEEDDPSAWSAAADRLPRGPAGCYEVVGLASWDHDLGRAGAWRGQAVVAGRIRDGVWGRLKLWPKGEIIDKPGAPDVPVYGKDLRFTPLVGQVRNLRVSLQDGELRVDRSVDPRIDPVNTVMDVVGKLTKGVQTEWITREPEGVVLHRVGEAGRREAEVQVTARFEGDAPVSWDLDLVGTYVHPGWIPAKVEDLRVRMRGRVEGGEVLPVSESLDFRLKLPLWTITVSQSIEYTSVVPCQKP